MKIQEIENRRNLSIPPKISSPGREKRQSPKMDDDQKYIPTPYDVQFNEYTALLDYWQKKFDEVSNLELSCENV